MKITEKESSHKTNVLSTLSLTGISLLWGHMLGLITWWALPLTVLCLLGSYANELTARKGISINV